MSQKAHYHHPFGGGEEGNGQAMAGWIKTKTRLGAKILPTFNPIDRQKLMTKLLHHQSQLYLEQDEITVASLAEFLNKVKTSVNNDDLLVLPQCLRG